MFVLTLVICCKLLKLAIWEMKSVLLIGLSGSWFFSCEISRFRKSLSPNPLVPLVPLVLALVLALVFELVLVE
jgi:hypothetical protein